MGKPVFDLSYLFDRIVKTVKPLNWEAFWRKQVTGELPLKIVASGLLSCKSVVLSAEQLNFRDLDELSQCMKASMCLPGIAGDAVRLQVPSISLISTCWTNNILESIVIMIMCREGN